MLKYIPLFLCALGSLAAADSFKGWKRLQVINVGYGIRHMELGDINGDGRDDILIVNTRQSRIECYSTKEWQKETEVSRGGINHLPLPVGVHRLYLNLDFLPLSVAVLEGGKNLIAVLGGKPLKVTVYRFGKRGPEKVVSRRLLDGTPQPHIEMLWDGGTLLISFNNGVQLVSVDVKKRSVTIKDPRWMRPRGNSRRHYWRLVDLNGDGKDDVLEATHMADNSLRWYPRNGDTYLAPQVLYENPLRTVSVLRRRAGALVATITANQRTIVRVKTLRQGKDRRFGKHHDLPMEDKELWCSARIKGLPAVVTIHPDESTMHAYVLRDGKWDVVDEYPAPRGVTAMAAVPGREDEILMTLKQGEQCLRTRWADGRLSFPAPFIPEGSAKSGERRAFALRSYGSTLWWFQSEAKDLVLYRWEKGEDAPSALRYPNAANKVDKALWIGGQRILTKKTYSSEATLLEIDDEGKLVTRDANVLRVLKKTDLDAYGFVDVKGKPRLARIQDGVLQWLGDNLEATDQVMLRDGQTLIDAFGLDDGAIYGLQGGGKVLHKLAPDASGLYRSVERFDLSGGLGIRPDTILGPVLIAAGRIMPLRHGSTTELVEVQELLARSVHARSDVEPGVSRVFSVTIDGRDVLIVSDDYDHRLSLVDIDGKSFKVLASWRVFDSVIYPYSGGEWAAGRAGVGEPRRIETGDLDGDGRSDLVMLSQDRCLWYLTAEQK